MKNKLIPSGLRDLLPGEVAARRKMEKKIAHLFQSYGFSEVITPTFEFLEVIETGTGNIREELFLFMDREGGILSLRPEVTVAIARLAATHFKDENFPQRLYYLANVFRHIQPQRAQYREFWQMGIELIGASGVRADAEVITIAVEAMRTIGVPNFKISLNQIAIFNNLLADSKIDEEKQNIIRYLVEGKDLVELTKVLESLPVEDELKETIGKLPLLHGGLEVLKQIPYAEKNRKASLAIEELINVYNALDACQVLDNVVLDMGVLRGLDYYTGIVFEGYNADLGYGLLGGGRYDNLIGQFGHECPATGFAMGLDRLALVLEAEKSTIPHYLVGGSDYINVVNKCKELREKGYVVEMDVENLSEADLMAKKEDKSGYELIWLT
ncbi:MAG TPA: ATP phosphoribosyltransferase regulatory subunit [Syntrophomonadaceae bacterium]|nr:ATP phosphoribosyltransferase regulatory subunit [Syntrophomonadaceae bacterium]